MSDILFITADELAVLRVAFTERDALQGEVCLRTVERDLPREQPKAFQRRLFAARSKARGSK